VSDEKPTPALFDHAVRVYEKMQEESTREPIDKVDEDAVVVGEVPTVLVYTGHLTRLFADLGIANPYYTKIMKTLEGLGCVEQLRRGGGAATSKWLLHKPPVEEIFADYVERKRAPQTRMHILEQRVRDYGSMLNDILDRLEKLEKTR